MVSVGTSHSPAKPHGPPVTLTRVARAASAPSPVSSWSTKALAYVRLLSPAPSITSKHLDSPSERIKQLRQLILLESLPAGEEGARLRPLVWKLLLSLNELPPHDEHHYDTLFRDDDIHPLLDVKTYYSLVSRDPSPMFSKIRNDTFRTLATDLEFKDRVGEDRLVRLLEAFVWRQLDATAEQDDRLGPLSASSSIDPRTPYVQGMNVLAAPFLYVLPTQIEAFACFSIFIEHHAPRYVRPTLDGVHAGLHLVDLCLAALDEPLHAHLLSHRLTAELYAFPSLLTFCASTPPLHEVLELWDFLLSWGVGLNVVCVVAQLWLMRDGLLVSNSPMKLLRTLPPLRSKDIIPLVVQFIGELDQELYTSVMRHPWDDGLRF
ncbi:BZ3500_MvSof-1268-A1-R1_Chr4-2g06938 [Microbotryum saponariae]|uniref:BZ3500_MvSof-1268-A1-R1_Chr4-2g06938 protein n=1 Tax=Microbotryum saponariae TaxID=289078 RepID=A0A2X0M3P1_9BASI|nr:BZ3500_MvSof-1268-A1-R1_Chr4-2g06938 [Microbotryum saponariae]SDA06603.1 BZ3501_MvSof-1269-A2-R1_Chr4-2g06649 [Microbotryum saponariae]